ncbi:MAG: hypothetical protein ACREP0_04050 [Rhodanobacteraceae bacterium]
MRTTIDIPDRQHTLFMSLAREQHTSLGKLLVELAERGLKAGVAEGHVDYEIDPETGLAVFRSGRPITLEDVKALEDEEDDRNAAA